MCAINQMSARSDEETQNRKETQISKEAVSRKKMNKGNSGRNQCKEILGWILDAQNDIMELTNQKEKCIKQICADMWHKERVSVKKWQCILGELHFMEAALPGAASLFGVMQLGLMHFNLHSLHDHLTDFKMLTLSIAHQPTHLAENAAITRMGGVRFARGRHPICGRNPTMHCDHQKSGRQPHPQCPGASRSACPGQPCQQPVQLARPNAIHPQ